jgi:hypothetical protein
VEKAFEYISAAERSVRSTWASSARLRTRVFTAFWNVRQSHLLSSTTWCPSWQRFRGLTTAFEDAYASGILTEASKALEGLTRAHAILGNAPEALTAARSAVLVAKQGGNDAVVVEASISSAVNLLYTNNWEHAVSFLPSREQLGHADPSCLHALRYFDALHALRSGDYSNARTLALKQTRNCKSTRWVVKTGVIAALASSALEHKHEARTLIEGQPKMLGTSEQRRYYAMHVPPPRR